MNLSVLQSHTWNRKSATQLLARSSTASTEQSRWRICVRSTPALYRSGARTGSRSRACNSSSWRALTSIGARCQRRIPSGGRAELGRWSEMSDVNCHDAGLAALLDEVEFDATSPVALPAGVRVSLL